MKKFFVIPPVDHMELAEMTRTKSVYCLAHLCMSTVNPKFKEYKDYFKDKVKEGWHVILDNSAAEDALVSNDLLIQLVKDIKPTEVIAPDVLYDTTQTRNRTKEFIELMKHHKLFTHTKIIGCPQGRSVQSYLLSYIWMVNNEHISTIGLSKLSIPESFHRITGSKSVSVNRRYVIKLLNELKMLSKPVHCLGMRNPNEFRAYHNIPMIRSTDSCWTCLAAMNNIVFMFDDYNDYVSETPHNYFFKTMSQSQLEMAEQNIKTMREITGVEHNE